MPDDELDPFVLAAAAEEDLRAGRCSTAAQLFLSASRWTITPEGRAELQRRAVDAALQAGHEMARA